MKSKDIRIGDRYKVTHFPIDRCDWFVVEITRTNVDVGLLPIQIIIADCDCQRICNDHIGTTLFFTHDDFIRAQYLSTNVNVVRNIWQELKTLLSQ